MKKLFFKLLNFFDIYGEIYEMIMYKDAEYSSIIVEYEGVTYKVSIVKAENPDGNS